MRKLRARNYKAAPSENITVKTRNATDAERRGEGGILIELAPARVTSPLYTFDGRRKISPFPLSQRRLQSKGVFRDGGRGREE